MTDLIEEKLTINHEEQFDRAARELLRNASENDLFVLCAAVRYRVMFGKMKI